MYYTKAVSTVTSQQPHYWSHDVIKKAPTAQTRSRGPVQVKVADS